MVLFLKCSKNRQKLWQKEGKILFVIVFMVEDAKFRSGKGNISGRM